MAETLNKIIEFASKNSLKFYISESARFSSILATFLEQQSIESFGLTKKPCYLSSETRKKIRKLYGIETKMLICQIPVEFIHNGKKFYYQTILQSVTDIRYSMFIIYAESLSDIYILRNQLKLEFLNEQKERLTPHPSIPIEGTWYKWDPSVYSDNKYKEIEKKIFDLNFIYDSQVFNLFVGRIAKYIANVEKYKTLNICNGINFYLHGPYGVGKTTLVEKIALELRLSLYQYSIQPGEKFKEFLNGSAKSTCNPFSPKSTNFVIVVIDEIDKVTMDEGTIVETANKIYEGSSWNCIRFFIGNEIIKNPFIVSRFTEIVHIDYPTSENILTYINKIGSPDMVTLEKKFNEHFPSGKTNISYRSLNHYLSGYIADDDPAKGLVANIDTLFNKCDELIKLQEEAEKVKAEEKKQKNSCAIQ